MCWPTPLAHGRIGLRTVSSGEDLLIPGRYRSGKEDGLIVGPFRNTGAGSVQVAMMSSASKHHNYFECYASGEISFRMA